MVTLPLVAVRGGIVIEVPARLAALLVALGRRAGVGGRPGLSDLAEPDSFARDPDGLVQVALKVVGLLPLLRRSAYSSSPLKACRSVAQSMVPASMRFLQCSRRVPLVAGVMYATNPLVAIVHDNVRVGRAVVPRLDRHLPGSRAAAEGEVPHDDLVDLGVRDVAAGVGAPPLGSWGVAFTAQKGAHGAVAARQHQLEAALITLTPRRRF